MFEFSVILQGYMRLFMNETEKMKIEPTSKNYAIEILTQNFDVKYILKGNQSKFNYWELNFGLLKLILVQLVNYKAIKEFDRHFSFQGR